MSRFDIKWVDGGRPPKVKPDPAYPDGKIIFAPVTSADGAQCQIDLPYPSPHENIGQWHIKCKDCGLKLVVTAASRPDDAKRVFTPCLRKLQ